MQEHEERAAVPGGRDRGGGERVALGQNPRVPSPPESDSPVSLSHVPVRVPSPVTSGMDSALPAPCPSNTARRGSELSARPGSLSCDIRISSSERKFSSVPSPGPTGKYASDMARPRFPPAVRDSPPPPPRMRRPAPPA